MFYCKCGVEIDEDERRVCPQCMATKLEDEAMQYALNTLRGVRDSLSPLGKENWDFRIGCIMNEGPLTKERELFHSEHLSKIKADHPKKMR